MAKAQTRSTPESAEQERPRLLVVDHKPEEAERISGLANDAGLQTVAAYTGEAAVEQALAFRPHGILLDVFMHGMNGFDAAVEILNQHLCIIWLCSETAAAAQLVQEYRTRGYEFPLYAKPMTENQLRGIFASVRHAPSVADRFDRRELAACLAARKKIADFYKSVAEFVASQRKDNPSRKRALILDDLREITFTLSAILERWGYTTRGTFTHAEAVWAAGEFRPDIFITGFNGWDNKNGCDTAAEVVDLLGMCDVLVLTAAYSTALAAAEDYRKRGYLFTVLPKPTSPEGLLVWLRTQPVPPPRAADAAIAPLLAADEVQELALGSGKFRTAVDAKGNTVPDPKWRFDLNFNRLARVWYVVQYWGPNFVEPQVVVAAVDDLTKAVYV